METSITRFTESDGLRSAVDFLADEEPLEIQVDTRSVAVTMRTPGHDAELALGFLVTEGILREPGQVAALQPYPRNPTGNVIGVFLRPDVQISWERLTRHVFASSSCGLCGKTSIAAIRGQFPSVADDHVQFTPQQILAMLAQLHPAQTTFAATGGLHAAGLFSEDARLLVLREDIGRHNAVDKVLGHAFQNGWLPLRRHLLMVSGRASFEIQQKALAAGVPVVAAVSAPSSLAVEFARETGQTLIGFLRPGRFNIYAGVQRIPGGGS